MQTPEPDSLLAAILGAVPKHTPESREAFLARLDASQARLSERVRAMTAGLTERERAVLRMRFADDPKALAAIDAPHAPSEEEP